MKASCSFSFKINNKDAQNGIYENELIGPGQLTQRENCAGNDFKRLHGT
jgi:hypothetical protein